MSPKKAVNLNDEPAPKLSAFSGCMVCVGLMIGSFSTPGKILKDVGTPTMALVMWVVGALVTFAGTLYAWFLAVITTSCYIELGTMLPSSGGEQAYLDVAFAKPRALIAFLFCWSMILCVRPGAAAADSVIFAQYVMYPFLEDSDVWLQRGVGILCMTTITLMNVFSTKLAIKIHDMLTVVKIGVLACISVMGLLVAFGGASWIERPDNFSSGFTGISTNGADYASALFRIFWAFDGWNNLNYMTGELENPTKNLPRAAGMGVMIVTVLYLIANFSYFTVLSVEDILEASELLAGKFFQVCFGDVAGRKVLPFFIALSAYGAVCAMVFSASRVIYCAAEAGLLPASKWIAVMNTKFKTPARALMVNYVLTIILIVLPPAGAAFDFLVEFVSYPTWVFYGISVVGLITMRKSHAHLARPIKTWIPVAVLFILASVFLSVFPFVPKESEEFPFYLPSLCGLLFILSGLPVWFFMVRGKNVSVNFDGGH